jgi:hypothetical protein
VLQLQIPGLAYRTPTEVKTELVLNFGIKGQSSSAGYGAKKQYTYCNCLEELFKRGRWFLVGLDLWNMVVSRQRHEPRVKDDLNDAYSLTTRGIVVLEAYLGLQET